MSGFTLRVEVRLKLCYARGQVRRSGFKFKSAMSAERLLHLLKVCRIIRAQVDDAARLQEACAVAWKFPVD